MISLNLMIELIETDWNMLDEYWVAQYEEDYGQFFSSSSCERASIPVTPLIKTRIPIEIRSSQR